MKSHHLARAASAARSRGIVVALAAAVGVSVPAHAGPVQMPCGSGWCFYTAAPLTSLSSTATSYLVSDMAAQFPGWTVVSGGGVPGAKISILQSLPQPVDGRRTSLRGGTTPCRPTRPGSRSSTAITTSPAIASTGSSPSTARWLRLHPGQRRCAEGQREPELSHGSAHPAGQPGAPRCRPPRTRSRPGRDRASSFRSLGNVATVYGGIQWGFKSTYSPSPITMVTQTYTIADATMGGWPFGGATVSVAYGYVMTKRGRLQVRRPDRRGGRAGHDLHLQFRLRLRHADASVRHGAGREPDQPGF